jgi:hypothetical protein
MYIDSFNESIYIYKQPKEGKVLKGFQQALKDHMISKKLDIIKQ